MTTREFYGPYLLQETTINDIVLENRAGNYLLSDYLPKYFNVRYVGRSTNLSKRLKEHLNEGYRSFYFSYAKDDNEAYINECRDYHKFGGDKGLLDNEYHPDAPNGQVPFCPECNQNQYYHYCLLNSNRL